MSTLAEVRMWGRPIGAVSVEGPGQVAIFEYTAAFQQSGIEVAPVMMPLSGRIYRFPDLPKESFHGLPGMLADALPDKFGNAVIDAWLASQGRLPPTGRPHSHGGGRPNLAAVVRVHLAPGFPART
jgi:serine/threonine-protein kinase HipA